MQSYAEPKEKHHGAQQASSLSISSDHAAAMPQIASAGSPSQVSQLQAMMNNRPAAMQLRKFQQMADRGPQARGLAQLQERMNRGRHAAAVDPVQRLCPACEAEQKSDEEELLQGKFGDTTQLQSEQAPQPNRTGLPDNLKSGIESLSGISMNGVSVHYNSSQPAQLNALAYAQGNDIHIAPGQEKHLPHEAWHVVQQAQGRVKPTLQMKEGIPVNDDQGLEHEADVMGAKAIQTKGALRDSGNMGNTANVFAQETDNADDVVQKRTEIYYGAPQNFGYFDPAVGPGPGNNANTGVGDNITAELDVNDPVHGSGVGGLLPAPLMANLTANFPGRNWVQGHLLNSDLGGLGLPSNLAPITQEANLRQAWTVEQEVKRLVFNQPAGNFELANHGYVEYEVDAQPVAGAGAWSTVAPDVDLVCNWRHQMPQAMPPGPGGPAAWAPWNNFIVPSRTAQTAPVVPAAWAPFGVGLGVALGGGGVVNAAIWPIAVVAALPAFIAAIGGLPAWNPPPGAVQVITQPAGGPALHIIGWQF